MRYPQGRTARLLTVAIAVSFTLMMPSRGFAQGGPLGAIQQQLAAISAQLNQLDTQLDQLDAISAQLDQLGAVSAKAGDLYLPFKVEIPGGSCDSAVPPTSNPEIIIDSDGTDPFVVTSIVVKRAFQNPADFVFLLVTQVNIDGTRFDTRTRNLFGPLGLETGIEQAADIMGMPVRQGGTSAPGADQAPELEPGGNVPHQIVADASGSQDIMVRLFCRSGTQDVGIDTILVAGWKKPGDTVSVTYVPGLN